MTEEDFLKAKTALEKANISGDMYLTPRGELISHQEGYNRFMKNYGDLVR